jgi:four helix bundle protein
MEKGHKQLAAWRVAMDLARETYAVVKQLPSDEKYGLASQMKRAAVSVPTNIAEGAARAGARDSLQFFVIARSSLSELDTHLTLCLEIGLLPAQACSTMQRLLDSADALLSGLIRHRRSLL